MGKVNDKLSYGITLVLFGLIFLLDKAGMLAQIPYGNYFMSVSSFFLIAGIVFLITQPKKALGWVFAGIGIFLNANLYLGWISGASKYLIPVALIAAGIFMVFSSKK